MKRRRSEDTKREASLENSLMLDITLITTKFLAVEKYYRQCNINTGNTRLVAKPLNTSLARFTFCV